MTAGSMRHIDVRPLSARAELGHVVRVPKAYPTYDEGYAERVDTLRRWVETTVPNVHPVGRNGMHRYNNQDHSMYTAMLTVENIVAGTIYDVWEVNVEEEYHEEKAPAIGATDHDVWSVNVEAEYHEEQVSGANGGATGRDAPFLPRKS